MPGREMGGDLAEGPAFKENCFRQATEIFPQFPVEPVDHQGVNPVVFQRFIRQNLLGRQAADPRQDCPEMPGDGSAEQRILRSGERRLP